MYISRFVGPNENQRGLSVDSDVWVRFAFGFLKGWAGLGVWMSAIKFGMCQRMADSNLRNFFGGYHQHLLGNVR